MLLSGLFALLVFLANVKGTNSPSDISCEWVCKIDTDIPAANVSDQHWKTVLSKTGQMKAIFPLHKRVEKDCVKFTSKENSSSFIEVWISTLVSTQQRKFGFLSFAISNFLENVLPFRYLFDGKYTEHEVDKISTEISCVLQPTSNESKRLRANGLDILYSPYFYIGELANFSDNRPFLSFIWTEDFYVSTAGFTNPNKNSQTVSTENEYSLRIEQLQYTVLSILGHLVCLYFTFYSASFLMLFRTNIGIVEIAETVIAPAIHPEGETELGEPTEQGRQEDEFKAQRQNSKPTEQGHLEDELKAQRQPDHYYNSSQPVELGHLEDEWKLRSDVVNSLEDCNTVPLPEQNPIHYSKLVDRRYSADRTPVLSIENPQSPDSHSSAHPDENKLSCKPFGTLGSSCTTQTQFFVVNILSSATLPESVITEASVSSMGDTEQNGALNVEGAIDVGERNHRAHSSISGNTVSEADTIEKETRQSGAHNRGKKNLKSVRVIRVGGAPSSVGLRNLISNYLLRYRFVKLFFLLLFPLFPVVLLDLFLLPSRIFSRISPSLPSTSMTISVFHFIYEKCPGLLVFLVLYLSRCICLCYCQSSANRVPSFLFRKHFWCFFLNCYITQLLFPNNDFTACFECKETPPDCPSECEFPVNIKRNDEMLLEIPMKDWKDVFHHLFPKYCQRFFPGDKNTTSSCSGLLKILSQLVFFIFCIILCTLDIALSSPIVCVCYGRMWFTAKWSADWCQGNRYHRCLQFTCLFIEFLIICSSIIWVVYLSICCYVALEIAFASLLITCNNYTVRTLLGWAIYIIFCHNLLSRYRSFTDKYDNLELMVCNMCTENHAKEIEQYQKGDATDVINIPEDLLVSVRNKLIPLKHSVRKLIRALLLWGGILLLLLIIISSLKESDIMVLTATVTLLTVLHPWLLDILVNLYKKKELIDEVSRYNVKRHVNAYFRNKLD